MLVGMSRGSLSWNQDHGGTNFSIVLLTNLAKIDSYTCHKERQV
jgi:hypothetical protein